MSQDGLNEQSFMLNLNDMVFQGIAVMLATAKR